MKRMHPNNANPSEVLLLEGAHAGGIRVPFFLEGEESYSSLASSGWLISWQRRHEVPCLVQSLPCSQTSHVGCTKWGPTLQTACALASQGSLHLLLLPTQLLKFPAQFRNNSNFHQPLPWPEWLCSKELCSQRFAVQRYPCNGHQWSTRETYDQ